MSEWTDRYNFPEKDSSTDDKRSGFFRQPASVDSSVLGLPPPEHPHEPFIFDDRQQTFPQAPPVQTLEVSQRGPASLGSFLTPPEPPRINEDPLEERSNSKSFEAFDNNLPISNYPQSSHENLENCQLPYKIPYYQSHCFHPPSQRPTIYVDGRMPPNQMRGHPENRSQQLPIQQYSLSSAIAEDVHHVSNNGYHFQNGKTKKPKQNLSWNPIDKVRQFWKFTISDHWKPLIVGGSFVAVLLTALLLFLLLPRQAHLTVMAGEGGAAAEASAFTIELVDGGPAVRVRASKNLQISLQNSNWVGALAIQGLQMQAIWHLQSSDSQQPNRALLGASQIGENDSASALILLAPKRQSASIEIPMDLEHSGDPREDVLYNDFLQRCYNTQNGSITVSYTITAFIHRMFGFKKTQSLQASFEETLPCPIDKNQISQLLQKFVVQ